jgi:3-hydroxyanthranilate 3,4-dioxygenase
MQIAPPINIKAWIEESRHLLKPPVGNQVVYKDTEFIIMVVGGPNTRKDYHVDVAEEFFYQLEGDMILKVHESNSFHDIPINEGEIFLLPPLVPHSPQRFADTVGLVIERNRKPGELDGFQWYCDSCGTLLYEKFIQLKDIVAQLPPLFENYWSNESYRTCERCGEIQQPPEKQNDKN